MGHTDLQPDMVTLHQPRAARRPQRLGGAVDGTPDEPKEPFDIDAHNQRIRDNAKIAEQYQHGEKPLTPKTRSEPVENPLDEAAEYDSDNLSYRKESSNHGPQRSTEAQDVPAQKVAKRAPAELSDQDRQRIQKVLEAQKEIDFLKSANGPLGTAWTLIPEARRQALLKQANEKE